MAATLCADWRWCLARPLADQFQLLDPARRIFPGAHPTYAVTPQREPLGVTDAWMWAREDRDKDGIQHGLKESTRWREGYERVAEMAVKMPATRLVYVADREADLVDMMARAQEMGTPADWLVRAKHNRCLPDGDGAKLWAYTTAGQAAGEIAFTLPARDDQKSRKVRQQLWVREVSITL